jgi:small subunit ribosomal protein S1
VENPREIIQPGDPVRVKILEIDSERRRLSLSIKRVEGQVLPVRPIVPPAEGDTLEDMPELGLSEDVFASSEGGSASAPDESAASSEDEAVAADEATRAASSSEADAPPPAAEDVADTPVADVPAADEPAAAGEAEAGVEGGDDAVADGSAHEANGGAASGTDSEPAEQPSS